MRTKPKTVKANKAKVLPFSDPNAFDPEIVDSLDDRNAYEFLDRLETALQHPETRPKVIKLLREALNLQPSF